MKESKNKKTFDGKSGGSVGIEVLHWVLQSGL